ncbi:MAG: fatty acid desaturase [Rhizobacter sp.]|nr:fatty acid desaturase [Bacteriovorax sp.]
MKLFWVKFRTEAKFLPGYFAAHILILSLAFLILKHFMDFQFSLHLNNTYLLYLPVALLFGIQVPTLMHNCVHGNLKLKKLNFIIGELTCFFVLMGMGIISINHTLHHAHSDSHMDPHNPADKSFLRFFFTSLLSGVEIIESKYYQFHGKSTKTVFLFKSSIMMHFLGIFLRLALWFLILGPNVFVAFFIPAFFFYVFVFSHVNYVTHAVDQNGDTQILNIDSNLYYNFINFVGSGIYFHKNHHANPKSFNPKYLYLSRSVKKSSSHYRMNGELL